MPETSPPKSGKRVLILLLKLVLVAAINLIGVFVIAKLLPLPKGQGLAYVAHPFFALVAGMLSAVAYFILSWIWPQHERTLLAAAIGISWLISFLIFATA